MQITIFAKKRKTEEGREFYTYLTTLAKKDGSELKAQVKFREDCGSPKGADCPMNIIVDKKAANLSSKEVVRHEGQEDEELVTVYTLWVSEWDKGPAYVDTSLDDFAD